jgi:hypothetical protein
MTNFPKPLLDSLKIDYNSGFLQTENNSVWMANKKLSSKIYKSSGNIVDYFY